MTILGVNWEMVLECVLKALPKKIITAFITKCLFRVKRLKCGFGPTVEERIVGEGAKGSSGAMWLFGRVTEGRARSYNHIRV